MAMGDIMESEELDRDTVNKEEIDKIFDIKYSLLTESFVSLKKSFIKKLAITKSLKLAACLSDDRIEIFELSNTSLKRLVGLSGHKKTLTEVVFSPKEHHLLYSSGYDGVIKLWDTRAGGTCVQEYVDENDIIRPFECMDVSSNDRVICASSQLVQDDAYLVFWDTRQTMPLGGYWNSHEDDITQVKFHKTKNEILATGGNDNLLNIFNIMEQTEDDALLYSLNIENSVEKITWLDEKTIFCVNQSNDVQIWDIDTGDMVRSYDREKVARSIKRSKCDDCYVIDAYSQTDNKQILLAGSYGGNGDVLRSVVMKDKKLQPSTNFIGNKQIVRSCAYECDRDLLLTAGESGLISVWKSGDSQEIRESNKVKASTNKLNGSRHKPY